jgi:predicted transcriptional regulator
VTAKEQALAVIKDLPENASSERISEEILIRAGIQRGLADVQAGRVKSVAEIKKAAAGWRDKWKK